MKTIFNLLSDFTMVGWKHGLCGCFNNITICCCTTFCPCYTFGKNAGSVGESCCCCCLISFVPILSCVCAVKIRGMVRDKKDIDGGCCGDCMVTWCCPCCSMIQVAQEMNSFGGSMASEPITQQPGAVTAMGGTSQEVVAMNGTVTDQPEV